MVGEPDWRVWRVDLVNENVEFRRNPARAVADRSAPPLEISDEDLVERAGAYLGTSDRATIIREGLKALCQREAARRLAALGGSLPHLEAARRRRFD